MGADWVHNSVKLYMNMGLRIQKKSKNADISTFLLFFKWYIILNYTGGGDWIELSILGIKAFHLWMGVFWVIFF